MTDAVDFDRTLGRWLDSEVASPSPQDLLASILSDTSAVAPRSARLARLRRSWSAGGRLEILASSGSRQLAWVALLAMLIIALLVVALSIGSPSRLPEPFGPAANGLIAYEVDGDIFVGDRASGTSRLIVGTDDLDSMPVYSPDGTHLAFTRLAPGGRPFDIVVVDESGGNPVIVTDQPVADIEWLDWTPDSRAVVFTSPVNGRALQIAASDGSGVATLVDGLAVDGPVYRPPGGDLILFRGEDENGVGLYTVRADGADLIALIPPAVSRNMGRDLREPRWSPDGSKIAYQKWSDELGQMRSYVMDANGTGSRPLPHHPDAWYEGWPVWSPDGTRIAIQRIFNDGTDAQRAGIPLAVIALDGQDPAVAVGTRLSGDGLRVEWSPDGTQLLAKSDRDRQVFIDPGGGRSEQAFWNSTSFPAWQRIAP